MRRRIGYLGAALMIIAFVILTIFIIAPAIIMPLDNAPLLKGIMQIAVCGSNETLTAGYSTYETPGTTSTSIEYNCVDKQQNARDVGDRIIEVGGIGYLVLFLTGLFTFLFGMQDTNKKTGVPSASAREKSAPVTASGHDHSSPVHVPLAQQLQELKDALDAGLITEAEYQSKRLELLS